MGRYATGAPPGAGRPKGSPNAETPQRAFREATSAAIKRKRPNERTQAEKAAFAEGRRYISALPLPPVTHALLTIHARRRNVALCWLVADILNLWCGATTDYEQAIFKELLPPHTRAPRTPERYPGYLASLGFADREEQSNLPPPPAQAPVQPVPPPPVVQAPIPTQPIGRQSPLGDDLTSLARPYAHPLTQAPASYPHPVPGLPPSAGLFDPQRQPKAGYANAAQRVSTDPSPTLDPPTLTPEVLAYLDYYKIDPSDVR